MTINLENLNNTSPPKGMEFQIAKIDFEGHRRACCQIVVEFRDPDNNSLEIYWGVDQVGSDGRVRPANEWHGVTSLEAALANPVPGQDTHIPK